MGLFSLYQSPSFPLARLGPRPQPVHLGLSPPALQSLLPPSPSLPHSQLSLEGKTKALVFTRTFSNALNYPILVCVERDECPDE